MLKKSLRCLGWWMLANALVAVSGAAGAADVIGGELKRWHKVTLSFFGPHVSEADEKNPFRDYRLNVSFTHATSGRTLTVPGYFAADGDAANTSANSGKVWRVHFAPDATGTWRYEASFRTGADVAISTAAAAGTPTGFDGAKGSFAIGASDKTGADFRGKGRLQEVGQHYLRHLGSGEYFVKAGAGSPENFLAYADFDNTPKGKQLLHRYASHAKDWRSGDPTWKGGKGRAIIGAVNYLAAKKMNSLYFLTMNVAGDGDDVFPWTAKSERYRYDVSKLAQWEVVFEHMEELGIHLHMVTQEQENDQLLDKGTLGVQRKLYYRELVARFGHHLGLTWNLGEETTNTTAQREAFADYINGIDPYLHLIAVHTFPQDRDKVYTPLLGHELIGGASLQLQSPSIVHTETLKWVNKSAASGRKWVVAVDELGGASVGVKPDAVDPQHREIMHRVLWGSLFAGAAGVEWYFGYNYEHHDLTCEDWTTRENMWTLTHHAAQFVRDYLPLPLVGNHNAITSATNDYCFGKPGVAYAIYLPKGTTTNITLPAGESYAVEWFDPRNGGGLRSGTVATVAGGAAVAVGRPPAETSEDWVALLRRSDAAGEKPEPEKPAPEKPETGMAVTGLTLIDAKAQVALRSLTEGGTIDLSADGVALNVRAAVSGSARSVAFYLDGKLTTENTAPWALAGDKNGVFEKWKPSVGVHTLRVVPYAGANRGGKAGEAWEISFRVVAPTEEPKPENPTPEFGVTGLTLIDAKAQVALRPLTEGETIDLSADGVALNVRAAVNGSARSVAFYLNGKRTVENTAPWALVGDKSGVYQKWTPSVGRHTLRVAPYAGPNASGTAGEAFEISFNVVATTAPSEPPPASELAITGFVLIDAAKQRDLRSLEDGAVISLSDDGGALNIRAETTGGAQSVWFSWNGSGRATENIAPFAFAGDNSGVYLKWKPKPGTHTLRAVPYSKIKRGGIKGAEQQITITVVN